MFPCLIGISVYQLKIVNGPIWSDTQCEMWKFYWQKWWM